MLLKVPENALQRHEEQAGNMTKTQQCTSLPSSDPRLRCHNLSANQKKYVIAQGPQQPKLSNFPNKDSLVQVGIMNIRTSNIGSTFRIPRQSKIYFNSLRTLATS